MQRDGAEGSRRRTVDHQLEMEVVIGERHDVGLVELGDELLR